MTLYASFARRTFLPKSDTMDLAFGRRSIEIPRWVANALTGALVFFSSGTVPRI